MVTDVHVFTVGKLRGVSRGANVEADDDGLRRRCQRHVGLGDGANTSVDDPQADLVANVDLRECILQGLDGSCPITLEDEKQLLGFALLQLIEQLVEGLAPTRLRLLCGTHARLTLVGDLPSHPVILDDQEIVTGTGHRGQSQHLYGHRWPRLSDVSTLVVDEGTHATVC